MRFSRWFRVMPFWTCWDPIDGTWQKSSCWIFCLLFSSFDRFVKGEVERKSAVSSLQSAKESILAKEQKISQMEADLKIEREWRQRLQTASVADKEALANGKVELTHLQTIANVIRNPFSSRSRRWEFVLEKSYIFWLEGVFRKLDWEQQ